MIKVERAADSEQINLSWAELGEGWMSHTQSQNVILPVDGRM